MTGSAAEKIMFWYLLSSAVQLRNGACMLQGPRIWCILMWLSTAHGTKSDIYVCLVYRHWYATRIVFNGDHTLPVERDHWHVLHANGPVQLTRSAQNCLLYSLTLAPSILETMQPTC